MARAWFAKSHKDLKVAKALLDLLSDENDFLDQIAFHCQQSIEKSLKGYLSLHKVRFGKTHDLVVLRNLALKVNSCLTLDKENLRLISLYAVSYRYPDAALRSIVVEDVRDAISEAERIFATLTVFLSS